MAPNKLRIVYTSAGQTNAMPSPSAANDHVTVRLEDVFPLLADAIHGNRSWLNDFADDPVTITSDLYEVLLAYEHHRRAA